MRTPALFALAALLLAVPARVAPAAAAEEVAVTNGGYMQTQTAEGQSVPLPLKHTAVEAEIAGMVSSVRLVQQFHNPYKKPIEAVYVFPLPERSAIYEMTIKLGKRTIRGIIKKRLEARQAYEQAKAQGKTAALLEQERPNIFTQSVANILPGDLIEVALRYVEDLVPEASRYEFSFPMVVGPRYVGGGEALNTRQGTGWAEDSSRIADASRITPPLLAQGLRPGHDIALRLRINSGMRIKHLQVMAHRAQVSHDAAGATVVLDRSDAIPNKDFVVRYQLAGAQPELAVLTQRDKNGGHFLLLLEPKAQMQQADIAPREYVFVVDNSGSMSGFPIEQAKAVTARCLKNLRPSDRFQIIKFAGSPDQFAPQAVGATGANVQRGIAYVGEMSGGGGTEFIPALKLALGAPKDASRSRIVLFMTDGYIGYEAEVLRFLRQHGAGANIFALGVGSSVNRFLIEGMARIGVGSPFYLLNTEKAGSVVERIFATISKPALTSIDIDWGGLDVEELTPSAVPDLFGEKPVFVVGRYGRGGSGTVTVRGKLAGKPFQKSVQLTLPAAATGSNTAVAYLWARRQIADYTDLEALEPSRQAEVEQGVTKLALSYSLMSKYTSFVAVDDAIRNQGGEQTTVPVPVSLPDGVSPLAAPPGAYVSGALMQATRMAPRRRAYAKSGSRQAADALSEADAPAPLPRPLAPTAPAPQPTALHIAVDELAVAPATNQALIAKELNQRVSKLISQLKSVGPGTSGTVKLRLVLDASGQVTHVAYLSGTLAVPSLKAELKIKLATWRFSKLSSPATVVLTLRLS